MDIENITPDREEIFGRLISVGLGRGGYLTVEDIIKPGKYENTDDDIYELLKLLRDENIAVYGWTESDRLDNKRIKEIVETVKNSCEEEKTSNSGGENTVKLYLKEMRDWVQDSVISLVDKQVVDEEVDLTVHKLADVLAAGLHDELMRHVHACEDGVQQLHIVAVGVALAVEILIGRKVPVAGNDDFLFLGTGGEGHEKHHTKQRKQLCLK